ncbi:PKD domain-containing protein [Aquibium sp. LZ166]|uniref:PKD domain-containing protein n=1 Tax=Aquibium pacificus TaxID=3153579 RepID=A0ABV3SIN5_9HYPH
MAALALLVSTADPVMSMEREPSPRLVTFGPDARINEGDHDFRQMIRLSVPADTGRVHVRVFDPDTGGTIDEPKGGFNSSIRFALFGAGGKTRLWRDAAGVVQESVTGEPLGTVEFGRDEEADGRWVTLFSANAADGADAGENRREFVLLVEGVSGNDGNVFDVALSSSESENRRPDGARLYAYIPTIQVPAGRQLAELRFAVPEDAEALGIENFDAAGGRIAYEGRFRSMGLAASGKSEWRRAEVALRDDEPGEAGSVTAAGGGEMPNDLTVFVGVIGEAGADPALRPVAVELPVRVFSPNRRPEIALNVTPLACRSMRFDAAASADPDGEPLTWRWRFGADGQWQDGATIEQAFEDYGVHPARLEVFDASGMVAGGAARDFSFFVKPPPVAAFTAPELVAEGAEVRFDGTASTSPSLPEGTRIARYHWTFGDGTELVQEAGDADFGRPAHRYARFGTYTVGLTVTDSSDNPCNQASASATVAVNAPPVANAGGDRRLTAGEIHVFDAGLSRDPDGSIVSFLWDFGDGARAVGPSVPHAFHLPGVYEVRLTVLDDTPFDTAKGIDAIEVVVEEPGNQRPTANAGGDRTVHAGEAVRFDAAASSDPDGEILSYAWDFGDGTGGDIPAIEHTYWEPGSYVATLNLRDDGPRGGERAIDSATITVRPAENRPPVAQFPSEFAATTWRPIRFDASAADDRDGSIIAYEWDFGDGTRGAGPVVEHLYGAPGTYEGRLELLDNGLPEPARVGFDFEVIVANQANLAPQADAGPDLATVAGEEIALDARASRDPDGSILTHEWDFGDGNRASGIRVRHVYQFPGTYTITLTVTDDGPHEKLTATDTLTVTVAAARNQPPVADAGSEITVKTGQIVPFDGTGSHDPDGNVMAYAWDFGDGGTSAQAAPRHAFHDPGIFRVRLTVTDDGSPALSAETVVTVTVTQDAAGGAQ